MSTHERIERHDEVVGSTDRMFGLVFAAFFTLLTVLKWWKGWTEFGFVWMALAVLFLALALTIPHILAPLNRLWTKLGLLLHRVVNPIIMGLLFFFVVTPIGLFMRATGKDLLRLQRPKDLKSYWIEREPPGPAPDTMKNQF